MRTDDGSRLVAQVGHLGLYPAYRPMGCAMLHCGNAPQLGAGPLTIRRGVHN
ncbi:MAG TPA: hypothetical protein VGR70_12620 [Stellaceae bacterium]|nr:hypothetical protein [Stellaceae bacterium]